ncbi:MAG: DNA repair protein RadC [Candidatus Woesearchaeota archaeon]|nr:DNA repair protein RadC [Candidatus Woesearchaeota archaeon]
MRIKDMPLQNRPRERLLAHGAAALSDAELIAVILRTGNTGESVIDVANQILKKYSVKQLAHCSLRELQKIKGVGPAKAAQLLAVFESQKRIKEHITHVHTAKDVFQYMKPKFLHATKETCYMIHVNLKRKILNTTKLSDGGSDTLVVDQQTVFRAALQEDAHSIILVHNHPSGDPTPSEEDRHVTKVLKTAGMLLGIYLLDHVIVGRRSYYSFQESQAL